LRKIRVLFVNPFYHPDLVTGEIRVVNELGQRFLRHPAVEKVGVLTTYARYPDTVDKSQAGATSLNGIEALRLDFHPYFRIPWASQLPKAGMWARGIGEAVRRFQPNIVHFTNQYWYVANWLVSRALPPKVGTVFTFSHHDPARQWYKKPFKLPIKWFNSYLARRVDRVIPITQTELEKLTTLYSFSPNKCRVIPWGINHLASRENLQNKGRQDKCLLLCVSRLSRHKGQLLLVNLFARCQPEFNKETELWLVGSNEGGQAEIERAIEALGLRDRVLLKGYVSEEELAEIYDQAHLFLLFSEYESFGLVFLEAMAHSLPVLTHAAWAIPEVLREGAFITSPYNAEQAADALVRLVNDDAYRVSLGRQACDYVAANFSWDRCASEFLNLYNEVLDEKDSLR